ncbi:MAG: hypothetical protein HY901_19290 [Deltaproteobacteria bacterium]|nr:hypothetical protein [Deltaproteobacteria bacterium]
MSPAVPDTLFAKALDALQTPVLVYDPELKVRYANAAALRLSDEQESGLRHWPGTSGELLRCVNARVGPSGCGSSEACRTCSLRRMITEAFTTQTMVRQSMVLMRDTPLGPEERHVRAVASPFRHEGQLRVLVELVDQSEAVALRNLLPLCSRCGAQREDEGYRAAVGDYFAAHPEVVTQAAWCERCREGRSEPPSAAPPEG